jgi:hypothetical protein
MRSIAFEDVAALGPGRAVRGQSGCARFDGHANLGKVDQQIDRELPFEQPLEDIGVQQVPMCFRLDDDADFLPLAQQALGGKHLDRFTHHWPGGFHTSCKLRFKGKSVVPLNCSSLSPRPDHERSLP